ncbi:hypothetical protein G7046_g5126 [Stylonectria norvegica]|nr:hypothetical protein G7046_g5126 [Stylonectria norvegica]
MGWVLNATPEENAASQYPMIIAVTVVLSVLAAAVVLARVYVRYGVRRLAADDWMSLLSMVFAIIYSALCITQTRYGLGLSLALRPDENLVSYTRVNYGGRPIYQLGISFFKIALLISYLRLLRGTDHHIYRMSIWAAIAGVFLAHLGCSLALIFACTPVKMSWNPGMKGHCLAPGPSFTTYAAITIVSDIIVALLPLPLLLKLEIRLGKKLGLIGIFGLGLFTTICSILRYLQIKQIQSGDGNSTMLVLWGTIEFNVGNMVSSLPFLAPIFIRKAKQYRSKDSKSDEYGTPSGKNRSHGPRSEHYRLRDMSTHGKDAAVFTSRTSDKSRSGSEEHILNGNSGITKSVTYTVRVDDDPTASGDGTSAPNRIKDSKMANETVTSAEKPVLIIGAGISGLLLAQLLRAQGVPFQVFERDGDLETRGVGWGLTLHWSLEELRDLLPSDLVRRLPSTYVDRVAVEKGLWSTFPFFDISTGELKAETPKASESQRIRVTRENLRGLLSTGIDIKWEKRLSDVSSTADLATATFDDGSTATGRLLVACDGGQSQVRRILFPALDLYKIPVRVLGVKLHLSPEQFKPIQALDPFFLQGTASENDTFVYISVLDAPGNNERSSDKYVCQMCVSWPYRAGFFNNPAVTEIPDTNEERLLLIQSFAKTWAEPFSTLAQSISSDELIKDLAPQDFPPPLDFRSHGRTVLMGDALHAMAMYRGEGANHAIVDVHDFKEHVVSHLENGDDLTTLRKALDDYEDAVVQRSRYGVLASRQACIDAHDWKRIGSTSPLLTKRDRNVKFEEAV